MRVFAFLMFALFPGTGLASAWQEYVYLDQGVAIQFPAKPQAMKSTYDSFFAKGLSSMICACEIAFRLMISSARATAASSSLPVCSR